MEKKTFFYILIRCRNSFKYFDKCVESVFNQKYTNYKILFIDDNSEYSKEQVLHIKNKLKDHVFLFNKVRKYSLRNGYEVIRRYAKRADSVIFNLDGDDWLLPDALQCISEIYQNNPSCSLTYGECLIWDGNKVSEKASRHVLSHTNTPYSKNTIKNRLYRYEPFRPLHPRTWKVSLFNSIPKKEFLDSRGKWLRFAEDQSIFYPMLERISGNYKVVKKPIYVYNSANSHADAVENITALLKDEIEIRRKIYKAKKYYKKSKAVNIYYNQMLSLPFIGNVFYLAQIILIKINLNSNIYLSSKHSVFQNMLIDLLDTSLVVFVKSPKLSFILKRIDSCKIFDCHNINLKNISTAALYELMWTLVHCDAVKGTTRKVIKDIIPASMPYIK